MTDPDHPGPDGAPTEPSGPERPGSDAGAVTLRQAFAALGLVALSVAVFAALVVGVHRSGLVEPSTATLPVLVVGLSVLPVLALYLHLVRRHRLSAADLGFHRPTWRLLHLLWQVPLTMLAGALVQGAVSTALAGGDPAAPTRDPLLGDLLTGSVPVAVLVVVATAVVTPLWEEVLFRGALLSGFLRHVRPGAAVAATAALFTLVHAFPPVMPYVLVLGLGLGWLRRFHGTLWAPVLLHACNNAVVALVVLTSV